VFEHARRYGDGLVESDVLRALQGQPSPFYGLRDLNEHLERIRALVGWIEDHQQEWTTTASRELQSLLPAEDPGSITVYPILGYDMGIGLLDCVCMNLNVPHYLNDPLEFFFYMIHEAAHVLYERIHAIPELAQANTPADWWATFGLWLQNEGFAVYAPLRLRRERDSLVEDADYRVLGDPDLLRAGRPLAREEYLERIFGEERILYRAGCELFRRIERSAGVQSATQEAFYLSGEAFLETYGMDL
jgi:hypothetical protein